MKILMVNKFLYPRGGAETYMLRIGQGLSRLGHEVEYFGMYDEKNTVGNREGAYTANMDFHTRRAKRLLYPLHILYSREAREKLGRVLDRFRPDLVHMNNINFQLTPAIIDEVKDRGLPLVQTVHDYQMICPNHLLYNPAEGRICERCIRGSKWNCARYGCIHGSRIKGLLGTLEALLYWGRGTYGRVDRYICPSRFLEGKLLEADPLYQGRTVAKHNFIELSDLTELSAGEGGAEKEDYVVFAGRLSREKGIRLLAGAARLLPQVRFMVAGTGELAEELRGIENVTLTGFLAGSALRRLIAGASVMAVPSIWYENCPLSILEAHALGTPVVTVDAGGMAELVEDGVTGALFRELTASGLAQALERTLADREGLGRMSRNCLDRRALLTDLEGYCVWLEGLYKELLKE